MFHGPHISQIALLLFQVTIILISFLLQIFTNIFFVGDHTLCVWNSTKPGQPVVKIAAHASGT